jgi:short-subunit dehydrogenase
VTGSSVSGPRVVLVTGASSGIGEATARAAAALGDHVVLLARGADSLQRVAADCVRLGASTAVARAVDVAEHTAVESAVSAVLAEHGRIDVAVANAGVVAYGRFEDVPAHVFEAVLRTNVLGVANLSRSVLPVMRRQKAGSLVVVGSVIGHLAVPDMAAYVVSKWGVRALARQLRLEMRGADGVRVAYVSPGGVDTPIYLQAANYGKAVGRPPMPVTKPEKVAARILAHADGRAVRSQVGPANDVMRFGFTTLPWVYDALVNPLFRVVAQDRTRRPEPGPGNVLESHGSGNALRGGQGSPLAGIGRNLVSVVRGTAS